MFVNKWYCWVIGLTFIAAGVTIPVAVYFALDASDACSTEDTSTCTATKGNCTNIESTWKCDCEEGYMNAAGDTQTCEDINECSTGDTSSCEADKGSCINMESTWRCECKEGYRNTVGNTQACEDVDECIDGDTSSCEAGKGNCMNMDSTWKCDCNDGYRNAVGDPQTCEDLNECIDGDTSSCEAGKGNCVNMASTWKCDCNDGYRNAEGDMQTCEDIDECSTGDASSCEAGKGSCFNLEGTWRCDCDEGNFHPEGDTQTCNKPELCVTADTSSCDPARGSCVETDSSWACQCLAGYVNFAGEDQACEVPICGMTTDFNTDEGELEFPVGDGLIYPHNAHCAWNLSTTPDKMFVLTFTRFDLEETPHCEHEYLKIQRSSGQLQYSEEFCGTTEPGSDGVYHASDYNVLIEFHSQDGIGEGFKLTWHTVENPCGIEDTSSCEAGTGECVPLSTTWACDCYDDHWHEDGDTKVCEFTACGTDNEFTTEEGEIDFPAGGLIEYLPDSNCVWTLSTTPGKIFNFKFDKFRIEYSFNCMSDYLEIQHGLRPESPVVDRLCGFDLPGHYGIYSVNASDVRLVFISDIMQGFTGFRMTWTTVEDYCSGASTPSCEPSAGICINSESTWVCGCFPGYENPIGDNKTCVVAECGNKKETSPGEGSLVYPGNGEPYYKSNDYCFWILTAPPGKLLTLTFSKIHIEHLPLCPFDYLEIQDPSNEETGVLGRFCGDQLPGDNGVFPTDHNEIRLVFSSDDIINYEGFELTWTSVEDHCAAADTTSCVPSTGMCRNSETTWVCGCNRGYANPNGDIKTCIVAECGNKTETSPGEGSLVFPGNGIRYYESNSYCIWILTAPPGKILTLTFSKIDMEDIILCPFDYLEIHDPSMEETGLLGRFCGDHLPGDNGVFTTDLNEIRLLFSSDEYENREGFALTWTSVEDHCAAADTTSCAPSTGMCQNSGTTWVCVCNWGYANPDRDIKTCILVECGNKTETSPGEGSLVFPVNGIPYYESNDYCIWILTAPPGKVLTLTFSEIHIEPDVSCYYDYLEIHDPSMEETGLLGRFCGDQLPGDNGVFTTDLNEIRLVFISDFIDNYEGFSLTWTSE